jgi:SulP family sulfate permease
MEDLEEADDPDATSKFDIPKGVEVYEINGPLFFGASQNFKEVMRQLNDQPKLLVLRMRKVPMIDATGLHGLHEFVKFLQARKTKVVLSGVNPEVRKELEDAKLTELIGEANILPSFREALKRANELV